MRQSGVLAAAALHALAHHRARLVEDHENARRFAERAAHIDGLRIVLANVETNIVNVDLDAPLSAETVTAKARELGLLVNPSAKGRLRVVTHLDVTRSDVEAAAEILGRAVASART